MRRLFAFILLAVAAVPAAAQNADRVDRRVSKLEDEMRAVQRKVFPGGNVQPEIVPEQQNVTIGDAATSPVADLTARVDALERQLATVTGQVEENGHRLGQVQDAFERFRVDAEARIAALERAAAPPPVRQDVSAPPSEPATGPVPNAPLSDDAAEEAYNAGYRLWSAGQYEEAQVALQAMAKKYPSHAKASWANNLAGRALLDGGKPAAAAKVLLANYQGNPKGERAADSLYFLGQALTTLKKPAEACQVYAELQEQYGETMRSWLKQNLPKARAAAKCG